MGLALTAAVGSIGAALLKKLSAARWMLVGYAASLSLASVALFWALLASDFRFLYVAEYTESALPFGYKLAAFWAGQEGSLLLWAWLLGAMGIVLVITQRKRDGKEALAGLAVFAAVCAFFAALMLFAANPFKANPVAESADGHGLNPMLQDPGMIAHPPTLFLGYAGFTVPFALMIGALVAGRRDNGWTTDIRRWCIFSWLALSVGILLGANWAYVELGWGGYWGWDPVENASLLPWLTGTALLHSIMAQQHKGMFKIWNASLVALTFILCVFGTYITRSGVIQSVHAFGESPIGSFFLTFLAISVVASVLVIVARRRLLRGEHEIESLTGREAAFLGTNILLVGMMLVTLVGTIFPLLSRTFGSHEVTIGQSFYNKVVAPLGLLLVALMALGPVLVYGKDSGKRLGKALAGPAGLGIVAVGALAISGIGNLWALAAALIGVAALANVGIDLTKSVIARMRSFNEPAFKALVQLIDSNHRRYGGQIVHVGVIFIVAGVVGSSLFSTKASLQLQAGESAMVGGQRVTFVSLQEVRRGNYSAVEARLVLNDLHGTVTDIRPQRRFYDKAEQPMSQVAIESSWRQDVYVTLDGWEDNGKSVAVGAIINPLVSWIWVGGVVLSLGGVFCLFNRTPFLARATRPSPLPSPGVPGEGEKRGIAALAARAM